MREKLLRITSCTTCKDEGWSGYCIHPKVKYEDIMGEIEIPAKCPLPDAPRQSVEDFALDMERMLRNNEHKGGWEDEGLEDMLTKLTEEKRELTVATRKFNDNHYSVNPPNSELKQRVIDEAADVGNIAMFIADIVRYK